MAFVFWDGYPELAVKAVPVSVLVGLKPQLLSYVYYVGKCDQCGRFHVKCLTCGDILAPPDGDDDDIGHQCQCRLPGFWLASTEEDEHGAKSAELHAVLGTGRVITGRPTATAMRQKHRCPMPFVFQHSSRFQPESRHSRCYAPEMFLTRHP